MASTLHVVILDQAALSPYEFHFEFPHTMEIHAHTTPRMLAERVARADVIINGGIAMDADLLRQNPQLRLIALASTGYEHIDVAAAKMQGITVCNVKGYGSDSVAEHAMMLMLAAMRQLPAYQADVAAGQWQQSPFFCFFGAPIHDLNHKNLVILGRGGIGESVAARARAFGMNIIWAEHKNAATCRTGYTPFHIALAQADVLSLHCPLTADTHHVLDKSALALLPNSAVIVNVGRGALIDEVALLHALQNKLLRAAAVDVLEEEPPHSDNLLLQAALPNLIITPHVAWASAEAMRRLFDMVQENINAFVRGEPQNSV